MTNIIADLYIVLGENIDGGNSYGLRAYYSPLLNWIWIGIGFMVFGGIISLSDRKHRLGYLKNKKANLI